jgi:phosphopantetheinyl transferase (holo-ACP synthase)
MKRSSRGLSFIFLSNLLFACAAQSQNAAEPVVPVTTATAKAPEKPGVESEAEPALPQSSDGVASTESGNSEPVTPESGNSKRENTELSSSDSELQPSPPRRVSPVDILTGSGTAFLIDYMHSPIKERAESFCEEQVKSLKNPSEKTSSEKTLSEEEILAKENAAKEAAEKKYTECLAKERSKFKADVLRFRRDALGNGTVTIYRRTGSSLPEVYVANVQYKEAGADSVQVIVKSGMSGSRPICRDRQDLVVKVPNGYSIELDDSLYGKLTYDAKVGLVGN